MVAHTLTPPSTHRGDPDRLLAGSGARGIGLYALIWLAPVMIAATADSAITRADAAQIAGNIALYGGYWTLWALAMPFAYRAIAIFGNPHDVIGWLRLIGVNALLLVALTAVSNLYFLAYNSWIERDVSFSLASYWWRFTRDGGAFFVGVHFLKFTTLAVICLSIRQHRLRRREEDARVAAELKNRELGRELAQARLASLRGQLHPHFLFNALNCIAGLIENNRNADAYAAVADLAALLRKTLDATQREFVPLGEDVELARAYLRIAKLRFGDRISWSIDVDDRCARAATPPLLLQPLVENAIKHAVERSPAAVCIVIDAQRVGPSLVLRVADNGPGFAPGNVSGGSGLSNLRGRLTLHYGAAAQVNVEDAAPGARVCITIPYPASGLAEATAP